MNSLNRFLCAVSYKLFRFFPTISWKLTSLFSFFLFLFFPDFLPNDTSKPTRESMSQLVNQTSTLSLRFAGNGGSQSLYFWPDPGNGNGRQWKQSISFRPNIFDASGLLWMDSGKDSAASERWSESDTSRFASLSCSFVCRSYSTCTSLLKYCLEGNWLAKTWCKVDWL